MSVQPYGSLCIDVSYASTADGTANKQWTCNSTAAQQWNLRGW
ncbi:RICIN domain-containing protein [Micromonospora sp. NPDC049204]